LTGAGTRRRVALIGRDKSRNTLARPDIRLPEWSLQRTEVNDMAQRCSYFLPETAELRECVWRPAADVYRARYGWLVKIDLAGVRPADVNVSLAGQSLIVSGERRDWLAAEGHQLYSMEIAYNRFQRIIEFPCALANAQLELEYRDGLLFIALKCEAS
jgi:HSP20 family protein